MKRKQKEPHHIEKMEPHPIFCCKTPPATSSVSESSRSLTVSESSRSRKAPQMQPAALDVREGPPPTKKKRSTRTHQLAIKRGDHLGMLGQYHICLGLSEGPGSCFSRLVDSLPRNRPESSCLFHVSFTGNASHKTGILTLYKFEHCLVHGGFPPFWWTKLCFKWAKCIF